MALPPPRKQWLTVFFVTLALALYWLMAVSVSPRMGVTADEVVHLTGGYSYWTLNDYRLHPENGNLAQRLATLPLLAMGLRFPSLEDPAWLGSKSNVVGEQFFFHEGNPVAVMLFGSRMMIALSGVFAGWLTWRWSSRLFGAKAGWIGLILAIFCPAMLAHGGLATSDMVTTACMLGALSAFWQLLHRATWFRLGLTALACGLAFLAKMSGTIIVPIIALLVVARGCRPTPLVLDFGRVRWIRNTSGRFATGIGLAVAVAVGSVAVLWSAYGFRYSGFNPAQPTPEGYYFSWDEILSHKQLPTSESSPLDVLLPPRKPAQTTSMDRLVEWIRDRQLLPEAYLWGFAHASKFARYRPAFLMGEYRTQGWLKFFPLAFLLKTPLPSLLLILVGSTTLLLTISKSSIKQRTRPWLYRALPLILFFFIYWLMALQMNLNIGHRHILPTYPVFYIFASATALWLKTSRRKMISIGLVAAMALNAGESLSARPFYLSYFQSLTGGMDQGYHYLVDSSFDWGQGLPDLERWLGVKDRREDITPVYLSYFGADSPRARGFKVVRFGDELNDYGPRVYPADLRGGWYVISATNFVRTYGPIRGPWTQRHERLYREMRQLFQTSAIRDPRTPEEHKRKTNACMDIELLQAALLFNHLSNRPPTEILGGSLLVFKLTDEEIASVLYPPLNHIKDDHGVD